MIKMHWLPFILNLYEFIWTDLFYSCNLFDFGFILTFQFSFMSISQRNRLNSSNSLIKGHLIYYIMYSNLILLKKNHEKIESWNQNRWVNRFIPSHRVYPKINFIIHSSHWKNNTMEVNGYRQLFVYQQTFSKENIFCVRPRIETHTGLEQVEGE